MPDFGTRSFMEKFGMTKGQRILAALVLALLGIYGTIIATGDRITMEQQAATQAEVSIEETTEAGK